MKTLNKSAYILLLYFLVGLPATENCGEGDWFFGLTDDSGFHFTVMDTHTKAWANHEAIVGGYVDDATALSPQMVSGRAAFIMFSKGSYNYPRFKLFQQVTIGVNTV